MQILFGKTRENPALQRVVLCVSDSPFHFAFVLRTARSRRKKYRP
jgi:hypothetical protein